MKLENWIWDEGSMFHGQIFGHSALADGTTVTFTASFVDWPARRFRSGPNTVELGVALAEHYYENQEDWPWPDSAN